MKAVFKNYFLVSERQMNNFPSQLGKIKSILRVIRVIQGRGRNLESRAKRRQSGENDCEECENTIQQRICMD
jgi:hypothetical protein